MTLGSGSILNSGTISLTATAAPVTANATSASASLTGGVKQQVQATGRGNSNLTAAVTNSNVISFSSVAGVGAGSALTSTAYATEVLTQRVQANGGGLKSDTVTGWNDVATVTLNNTGTINLSTNAQATSSASSLMGVKGVLADFATYSSIYGSTYGEGLNQDYLKFSVPSPVLSEHGVISQRGQANGWGDDVSDLTFTNAAGAAINVTANAAASNPVGPADARSRLAGLVVQKTQANGTGNDKATAIMTNAGRIGVAADSVASSAAGNAVAVTTVNNAVQQGVEVTGPTKFVLNPGGGGEGGGGEPTFGFYNNIGELAFTNAATGVVDVRANARGTATGGDGEAHAYVDAGVAQTGQVDGGTPKATIDNRNTLNVAATSVASGTKAFASAGTAGLVLDAGFPIDEGRLPTAHDVVGVSQSLVGKATDARFTNSGTLGVSASATATGAAGGAGALASAFGYEVTGEPVGITVANSGTVNVSTTATATAAAGTVRLATAKATGMGFFATVQPALPEILELVKEPGGDSGQGQNGHPPTDTEEEPSIPTYALTGTVMNSTTGNIVVAARSTGDAQLPDSGFVLPRSIASGQTPSVGATAVGVDFLSASNAVTMQNAGTIDVSAVTTGALAKAFGVRVGDYENSFGVQAVGTEVFTLNNVGGTIRARISTNNGTSYKRGVAIDTSGAPNKAIINLDGAAGRNGLVYGNVDISADDEIYVRNGETALDGVVNPGGPAEGSLVVRSGGTLYLVNQSHAAVSTTGTQTVNPNYDGPAGANVNAFTVESGAKLALQMPSFPTSVGAYQTVVANKVTLGATSALELRPSSWNGLYANSYNFNNVIKAPNAAALNGTFAPALVRTDTGTPLLAVQALYNRDIGGGDVDIVITRVGFGAVPGLTVNQAATGNGIERIYSPTLTGPFAALLGTMFRLDAASYPGALQQLSGDQYAGYLQGLRNYSVQTNSMISDQLDCAISIDGPTKCRDRDGEVRVWALGNYNNASVDTDINAPGYSGRNWSALLGADYTSGNFTFGVFGGYRDTSMDFTRGASNIKANGWQLGGVAAYDTGGFYVRAIGSYSDLNGKSVRSIGVGSFVGTLAGQPDTQITSIYGEAGARFDVGKTWMTPFAALDHTNVRLNSFTETGVPGANLAFAGQSESQTSLLAGLKWAGNFGGIIPEAKVAWRYDLNSALFGVEPGFADAPAGGTYRVFAPQTDRSAVVVGFSLAAALGEKATGRIGYQGRYNSQVNDSAFYGSLTVRFGGAKAPAPVAAAPVPVPAPVPAPAPLPACPPPAVTPGPFLVFFDWDKSLITSAAASILDRAAEQYSATGQTNIMLAGNADRSGTEEYNMQLSKRRADAVKAYMTSKGVAETAITTEAFGESRPLVETADGAREPQNRRVEMTYGGAQVPANGPCTPQ